MGYYVSILIIKMMEQAMKQQYGREAANPYTEGHLTHILEILRQSENPYKALNMEQKFGPLDFLKIMNIMTLITPMASFIDIDEGSIFSATETLAGLKELPNTITLPNTMASVQLLKTDVEAAFLLFHMYARTVLMKKTQLDPDYRRYGSLTPLALYAFKERHNIKYMQWDNSDKRLSVLLGCNLVHSSDDRTDVRYFRDHPENSINIKQFMENQDTLLTPWREKLYTVGSRYHLNYSAKRCKDSGNAAMDMAIAPVLNMALQGHLAQARFRISDVMILDPTDWDSTPPEYDDVANIEHRLQTTKIEMENALYD
jgi:hypothetical protein